MQATLLWKVRGHGGYLVQVVAENPIEAIRTAGDWWLHEFPDVSDDKNPYQAHRIEAVEAMASVDAVQYGAGIAEALTPEDMNRVTAEVELQNQVGDLLRYFMIEDTGHLNAQEFGTWPDCEAKEQLRRRLHRIRELHREVTR